MQARSFTSVTQIYFDIHWNETGRHTYLTQPENNSGTQMMHFSLCHMSQPHTDHENSSPVKPVNILGLFLCIHECSGSFAWMWDVSVHHRKNRILTLYQRWNNVIVNEWGFCFPPKELQAVSYFELRDPLIFWLFLLLMLISSADISAAHVIWWDFLKILFLYQVSPK